MYIYIGAGCVFLLLLLQSIGLMPVFTANGLPLEVSPIIIAIVAFIGGVCWGLFVAGLPFMNTKTDDVRNSSDEPSGEAPNAPSNLSQPIQTMADLPSASSAIPLNTAAQSDVIYKNPEQLAASDPKDPTTPTSQTFTSVTPEQTPVTSEPAPAHEVNAPSSPKQQAPKIEIIPVENLATGIINAVGDGLIFSVDSTLSAGANIATGVNRGTKIVVSGTKEKVGSFIEFIDSIPLIGRRN